MTSNPSQAGSFQVGDLTLLIDRKKRRYLVRLEEGKTFHSHAGGLNHDDLIGKPEGTYARSSGGGVYLALRPTLAEYTVEMGRGATPIYPKDTGPIITYADIYPGARVLEAGIGSGALTLTLLRAIGAKGQLTSYEIRPDFAEIAQGNVQSYAPDLYDRLTVRIADIYEEGIAERDLDRIVLDLAEPWRVLPHAQEALRPGGIILTYVPTTIQLHQVWQALDANRAFGLIEQFEVILRPWDAAPQSLRPAHRMVAHTGFITTARRLGGGGAVARLAPETSSTDVGAEEEPDGDEPSTA